LDHDEHWAGAAAQNATPAVPPAAPAAQLRLPWLRLLRLRLLWLRMQCELAGGVARNGLAQHRFSTAESGTM